MDDKVMGALIGVVGVVLGLGWVSVKEFAVHWAQRKRDPQYLAVRIVCILDAFVRACVDVAEDDGEPDQQGGFYSSTEAPSLSFDSLEVEWKAIPVMLTYAILNLPAQVDLAGRAIAVAAEYSDDPDHVTFFRKRQERHVALGVAAL